MHPALKISSLILLAVSLQLMTPMALTFIGILVISSAVIFHPQGFMRMVRRSRWLLLTMLLVFAWTTPGEYLAGWPVGWSPTYEGLHHGVLQAARLTVMLAGLAVLMGTTDRDMLMAGVFVIMQPFRGMGVVPERIAARLWLTLHYVESAPSQGAGDIWTRLNGFAHANEGQLPTDIALHVPEWRRRDGLLSGGMGLAMLFVLVL